MKTAGIIAALVFALGVYLSNEARAGEAPPVSPYSGDIWTRSTLSGDGWDPPHTRGSYSADILIRV